jgi:Tfp pilus assembly protein PilO
MAETPRSTPILLILIALLVGYAGYTGDILNLVGITGARDRMMQVDSTRDTLATLQARIDSAKRSLATESVEQVRERAEAYGASLGVLRSLVPEQSEVANLIDDINIRAKVRGLQVVRYTPATPVAGPEPFDTHSHGFAVVGRFNQVGQFLTDIATLRRIIVPTEVTIGRAEGANARFFGDTLSTLQATFNVRTYVKAPPAEDSTNGS